MDRFEDMTEDENWTRPDDEDAGVTPGPADVVFGESDGSWPSASRSDTADGASWSAPQKADRDCGRTATECGVAVNISQREEERPTFGRHEPRSAACTRAAQQEGRNPQRAGRGGRWWLALCLVLSCLLAGRAIFLAKTAQRGEPTPPRASAVAPAGQPIESIRVGQRVVAENPDPESSARTAEVAVDPATWRRLRLEAEDRWADGTLDVIEVETLQPPEWIAEHGAQPGAVVPLPLDLLEMGLPETLRARVLSNDPCPAIPPGPGCIVLTTVNHLNPNLFELRLGDGQGNVETVRPTGLHKFYSAERRAWVNTEELREGERLRGRTGWLTVAGSRVFRVCIRSTT